MFPIHTCVLYYIPVKNHCGILYIYIYMCVCVYMYVYIHEDSSLPVPEALISVRFTEAKATHLQLSNT